MKAGLRSSDGFELRRCQIILASARGEHAFAIAQNVGCSDEAVREAIKAFNLRGLQALKPTSRRPHKTQAAFGVQQAERLKEILHQSPRTFGKPSSVWTCELAAEVSFEQELIQAQVKGDSTVRLWEVASGREVRRFAGHQGVQLALPSRRMVKLC